MKKILRMGTMMLMVMMMALGFGAVLSADASITRKESGLQSFPVKGSSTQIYKGAFVCVNTDGYLVAAADTEALRFVGVAYENVLNAGSDGDKTCRVHTEGVFQKPATSITQAMVGCKMFIVDDATFDDTSTNKIECGTLVSYDGSTSGWVSIGERDQLTGLQDHVYINTDKADKNVRINSKTFVTDLSIIGAQIKPRAGVNLTNDITGLEVMPGIGVTAITSTKSIIGINVNPYLHATAGAITGDVRGIQIMLEKPAGAGTVTGIMSGIQLYNDANNTVTGGIFGLNIANNGGVAQWTGLANFVGALGTHSMTTDRDKTGNGKSGTIKVYVNNTLYHIQLYANA